MKRLIETFDDANNYRLLEQRYMVEVIEVGVLEKFDILPGVEAVACKTPHTPESHAIHIRESEETLVFTADTGFDEVLATFANGVDLFILECSFVRHKPVEKHLELAEAMYLVRKAKPKRAMLTHFYPEWDEVDFQSEIKKFEPMCEVIEAVDGIKLTI